MAEKSRQFQDWQHGDPTPPEILQRCEQIQAGWSDFERAKRSGMTHRDPWEIPVVQTAELVLPRQTVG
jgi:hypothetical protein